MGRIEVICGSMYSGKTEELLRRIRRLQIAKKTVMALKPIIDNRYGGIYQICTHDGVSLDAVPVGADDSIVRTVLQTSPLVDVVAIDEAQFFPESIVYAVQTLADCSITVLLCGTDTNFRGEPFGSMGSLMCIADTVTKLNAVCVCCGGEAIRNQRLVDGVPANREDPEIVVGSKQLYEARCRRCFEI